MSLTVALLLLHASFAFGCDWYPFFNNERWLNFFDDCRLEQSYDGNAYTLRVELPFALEKYMTADCLNSSDIGGRHFKIVANLREKQGPDNVLMVVSCVYQEVA